MGKGLWLRRMLLVLGAGTALGLGFGGCLLNAVQRYLVASIV